MAFPLSHFRKSRRGNLLLTAIFISVFLFFLSVALVSLNRQDITLAISVDHRMRAWLAARGGANEVLQTMRSVSVANTTYKGAMKSGATWNVTISPYPVTGAPNYYKEIVSQGTSGFITIEYRMVVEELDFAESLANEGIKPHLFALSQVNGSGNPNLMLLGPSMQWSSLASLSPTVASTMAAGGSALAVLAGSDLTPPVLQDWTPSTIAGGFTANNSSAPFAPTNFMIPTGPKVELLRIQGSTLVWDNTVANASKVKKDPIQATPETVTNNTQSVQVAPGVVVQVDMNEYRGPIVDWYDLTGRLTVDNEVNKGGNGIYYCFATHYIFQGSHWKNTVEYVGGYGKNSGYWNKAGLYTGIAILCYKDSSQTWSVYSDTLTLSDPNNPPTVATESIAPYNASLCASNGKVFCLSSGSASPPYGSVLVAKTRGLQQYSYNTSQQPFLQAYQGEPLLLTDTRQKFESNQEIYSFGSSIPLPNVTASLPTSVTHTVGALYPTPDSNTTTIIAQANPNNISTIVNAIAASNMTTNFSKYTALPDQNVTWLLSPNPLQTAIAGKDLITVANMFYRTTPVADYDNPAIPNSTVNATGQFSNYTMPVLLHYDGTAWQVLPQGAYAALWDSSRALSTSTTTMPVTDYQGSAQQLSLLFPLALAGYLAPQSNLMHRYAPIVFPPNP